MTEETSMSSIVKGKVHLPPRIVLYGIHGIGKSTLAADAPKPIFIQTEEGANEIDVAKFPPVNSTKGVLGQLRLLYKEKHDYKTCVLDTVDWLEDFIHLELKEEYTDKELSYGKDSALATEKMAEILTALNHLRVKRDMACVLVCHTEIKRFDSPITEPYDRYQPKLQARMSALVQEWADLVGFCIYDVITTKEEVGFNKEVRRGIGAGERKVYTEERPAFYAKNRYGMPPDLDVPEVHPFAEISRHIPYYALQESAKAVRKTNAKTKRAT